MADKRANSTVLRWAPLAALGLLFFMIGLLAAASPASASTCTNNPTTVSIDDDFPGSNPVACQFKTLAGALPYAVAGDTMYVFNGTYAFSSYVSWINITNLSIIGEGQDTVVISANGSGAPYDIYVNAPGFTLFNITVAGANFALWTDATNARFANISNVTAVGTSSTGIVLYGPYGTERNLTIRGCAFGFASQGPGHFGDNIRSTTTGGANYKFYSANTDSLFTNVTLVGATSDQAVQIQPPASNLTLRNFYVENATTGGYQVLLTLGANGPVNLTNFTGRTAIIGIYSPGAGPFTINGMDLGATSYGYVTGNPSSNLTISNALIHNTTINAMHFQHVGAILALYNVSFENTPAYTVHLYTSGRFEWYGGRTNNTQYGVYAEGTMNLVAIANVSFANVSNTAVYMPSNMGSLSLENCTLENLATGAYLANTDGARVVGNTFRNISNYALRTYLTNSRVAGNTFTTAQTPFLIDTVNADSPFMYYNMTPNNVVDGVPMVYLLNQSNIVLPASVGHLYLINVSNVRADGIVQPRGYYGVFIQRSSNVSISNATLNGSYMAAQMWSSFDVSFQQVSVVGKPSSRLFSAFESANVSFVDVDGSRVESTGAYGFYMDTTPNALIQRARLNQTNFAFFFVNSPGGRVLQGDANLSSQMVFYGQSSNNLWADGLRGTATGTGIYLYASTFANVSNTQVKAGSLGFYMYFSGYSAFFNDSITSTGSYAGQLQSSSNVTVRNCTFVSTVSWGVDVQFSPDYRTFNSTYQPAASYSLVINTASYNSVALHNNFYSFYPYDGQNTGTWDAGYPTGGNYHGWYGVVQDQYTGAGQNSQVGKDGIKDAPGIAMGFSTRLDNYALVDPWPPTARVTSPPEGSAVKAGSLLNFSVSNFFDQVVWTDSFDGSTGVLAYPHDLNTTGWADGFHNITLTCTDGIAPTVVKTFVFEVDNSAPLFAGVPIIGTTDIAEGTVIVLSVIEPHLFRQWYRVDGGSQVNTTPPWMIDTTGWSAGMHTIDFFANDTLNFSSSGTWNFYLDTAAPLVGTIAPLGVEFAQPGIDLTFSASDERVLDTLDFFATGLNGTGPYTGQPVANSTAYSISTVGWSEGCYDVQVTATDQAGHVTSAGMQICLDATQPFLGDLSNFVADEDVPYTFPGDAVSDLDWNLTITWSFDDDVLLTFNVLYGRAPTYTFRTPGTYTVDITASDRAGNSASVSLLIDVLDTTDPTASFVLPATYDEDMDLELDASLSADNDGYWGGGLTGTFEWLIEGPSGSWTVSGRSAQAIFEEPGFHNVTLTVSDRTGNSAGLTHEIQILDVTAPNLTALSGGTFVEGVTIDRTASATDNDPNSTITYAWTFTYGAAPQTIEGPALSFLFAIPGTYAITITATDSAGNAATSSANFRINDVPTISNSPPSSIEAGSLFGWTVQIADSDALDPHTLSVVDAPPGLQVGAGDTVQWLTTAASYGIYRVTIRVSDGISSSDFSFTLQVTRPLSGSNRAPAFTTVPSLSGTRGGGYAYTAAVADADGDTLTLLFVSGPAGMTFSPTSGISWTVPAGAQDDATFPVSLVVSDGLALVYQNFTIRVRANDASASFASGAVPGSLGLKINETKEISFAAGMLLDTDDSQTNLTISATVSDPTVASVRVGTNGQGFPTVFITGLKDGTVQVTIRVSDPSGLGQSSTVPVTVSATGSTLPPESQGGLPIALLGVVAAAGVAGILGLVVMRRRKREPEAASPDAPTAPADEAPAKPAAAPPPPVVKVPDVAVPIPAVASAPAPAPAPAPTPAIAVGAALGAAAAAASQGAIEEVAPVAAKALTYVIEGLFVIYQDGRMIYSKTDIGQQQLGDPELVSSMFTAVQQFIKDSFSAEGELNKMGYGENAIVIERGNNVFMAVITFGEADKELQETMRDAIEKMEYAYAGVIEKWDGNVSAFKNLEHYVAPVLALTATATRGDVLAATTTREVKVLSQLEFFQGFVRLKVGVKNDTEAVVTKVTLDIDFNEDVLRLQRIEPATYRTSGARVMLNVLNPGEKSSVAFYFDPQICTETNIDGIVRYRDYKGTLRSVIMKTRKAEVVCPLFFTKEHANTAMLKRLIETELNERDSKVYTITKLPPYVKHKDVFEVCKSVVASHDVQMVREFLSHNPFGGEAWFYGETKVKGYKIVIRTAVREDNTIEFFAASTVIKAVTGLLAEFNHTLTSMIVERYSDVKIEQVYDEAKKHEIQSQALVSRLGEGDAAAGETEQRRGA